MFFFSTTGKVCIVQKYQLSHLSIICLDNQKCDYFITNTHIIKTRVIASLIMLTLLFYGLQAVRYIAPVLFTIVTVWFGARYCDGSALCRQMDVVTIYLLVCQCVCLMWKWQLQQLPWFSLTRHQEFSCLLLASMAFLCTNSACTIYPFGSALAYYGCGQ